MDTGKQEYDKQKDEKNWLLKKRYAKGGARAGGFEEWGGKGRTVANWLRMMGHCIAIYWERPAIGHTRAVH